MDFAAKPDPIDVIVDSILSDTSPITADDMADVEAAQEAIRKGEWRVDAALVLQSPPYSWTKAQAEIYADSLADDYFADGWEPEDAIIEDSNYWD